MSKFSLQTTMALRKFCSAEQINTMMEGTLGEEGDFFRAKMVEMVEVFNTMPATRGQEGVNDPIAYLHYFLGSADWYITERDLEVVQHQAFGWGRMFAGCGECGYISIVELIQEGVELDLHFEPKPLSQATGGEFLAYAEGAV